MEALQALSHTQDHQSEKNIFCFLNGSVTRDIFYPTKYYLII